MDCYRMRSASISVTMTALLLFILPVAGWSGEQQVVLHERLNRAWKAEVITRPFSAPAGTCHPQSVTVTGPKGPVPVQLIQVATWPGTPFVKSARLAMLVDLAPLATDTYTVRYDTAPVQPLPTDLHAILTDNQVEILAGGFTARLRLGETAYNPPVIAASVPGPLVNMQLADGTTFGGSRLYSLYSGNKVKVGGATARITEQGPLLIEVTFTYRYDDGSAMVLTAQRMAGDPQVHWAMQSDATDVNAFRHGWDLLLTPGLTPLHVAIMPEYYAGRWSKGTSGGDSATVDVDLVKEPVGQILTLTAWDGWWDEETKNAFTFSVPGKGDIFTIITREADLWVEPGTPAQPYRMVRFEREADGTLFFRFNNSHGQRRWQCGIALPGWGNSADDWRTGRWQRLDTVLNDYILEWDSDPKLEHPHLYTTSKELKAFWSIIAKDDSRLKGMMPDWGGTTLGLGPPWDTPLPGMANASIREKALAVLRSYKEPVSTVVGAYLLAGGDSSVAAEFKLPDRLRELLGMHGDFGTYKDPKTRKLPGNQGINQGFIGTPPQLAVLYDVYVDNPIVTPEERKLWRAQMAYLGYMMADPSLWSPERGYCPGNPNFISTYASSLGLLACAIPDHPKAKAWVQDALDKIEWVLSDLVGPEGEFKESVANYAYANLNKVLPMAVAARNAGFKNYVDDPRMKKALLYLAKMNTPRDPRTGPRRKGGLAAPPPIGRGSQGGSQYGLGLLGLMANATRVSDPALSAQLEWAWGEAGYPRSLHGTTLTGYEWLLDATLPVARPNWTAEYFPNVGAVLRHGIGTPADSQVHYLAAADAYGPGGGWSDTYTSESGGFPLIFLKGAPISSRWGGGDEQRSPALLCNRVLPLSSPADDAARLQSTCFWGKRAIVACGFLPRQDYLDSRLTIDHVQAAQQMWTYGGKFAPVPRWPAVQQEGGLPLIQKTLSSKNESADIKPIGWQRQFLFIKDDDPAAANYLLLRDTVSGGEPTMWQFWTLSEKLGTPGQVHDRAAFLADKPGLQNVDAAPLPPGDRYTALGQFGVDLEFYIACPRETPRHTLHMGRTYPAFSEYMDLLHLQLPGDGVYFVALFPRKPEETIPTFSTLGNGTIIKVQGDFGVDYGFLSARAMKASGELATFMGTAGSVQDRKSGLVLSLGAKGSVGYKSLRVTADVPVSMRVAEKRLMVAFPAKTASSELPPLPPLQPFPGGTVKLTVPGEWVLVNPPHGATLTKNVAGWVLTVPAGTSTITLTAKSRR